MNKQLKRQWLMGLTGAAMLATSLILNNVEQDVAADVSAPTVTLANATAGTGFKCLQDCATCQACFMDQQAQQIQAVSDFVNTPDGITLEV
jgi:hypothetical protein